MIAVVMVTQDLRERAISYIRHQAAKPRDELVRIVAAGQERLLKVVEDVADDVTTVRPTPDEWSLRELMLHVVAAQHAVAGLLSRMTTGERVEIKNPDAAIGMALPDDGSPHATLIERLRAGNEQMLAAVRRLPDEPDLTITPPHPWFGQLNCLEWAAFQRLHDEDHIQHAQKILAAVG